MRGNNGKYLTNKLLEFTNSIETAHRVGRDVEMREMKDGKDGKDRGDAMYAEKLGMMFGERMEKMN